MNAYGHDVLSAQEATDAMLAAVRAGKFDPKDLAASLGQVLPVAAEMGVKFDEVNAALASLSKTGTPVTQGVSQLRSAMVAFLKPGEQAGKILSKYGLSAAIVREQIRDKGLIETLITLREKFKGNEEELAKVIGRVEGFNAVLALTGDHAGDTRDVLDQIRQSAGLTDEAFKQVSETASHQFNQSMAELETIGIEIATNVLPPIVALLKEFNSILKEISPEVKAWVVQMGLLALALTKIAPLLLKISKVRFAFAAGAGGPAAVIAGALVLATILEEKLKSLESVQERMAKRDKGIVGTIIPGSSDQAGVVDFLKNFKTGGENLARAFDQFRNVASDFGVDYNAWLKEFLTETPEHMQKAVDILGEYGPKLSDIKHEFREIYKESPWDEVVLDAMEEAKNKTKELAEETDNFGEILQQSQALVIIFGRSIGGLVASLASAASGFKSLFSGGIAGFKDLFKGEKGFGLGSIVSGFASALPAIGAIAGPIVAFFGKIFKPKWKKLAEEAAKIFGQTLSEGLAKEILKASKELGSVERAYAAKIGDIISEVGVNAKNIGEHLKLFNDLLGLVEDGTLDWAEATEQISKALPALIDHLHELGIEGSFEIGKLIARMRELGEVTQEVQDFIKQKAEEAIGALSTYFSYLAKQEELTTEEAKNALTVMAGAFEAAVAAAGSLVGAIRMLGPEFGELLEKLREVLGENNAMLNAIQRYYNFVKNNEDVLGALEALAAGFTALAELGIVNKGNIDEYAQAFKDLFDDILAGAEDQQAALAAIAPQIAMLLEAYRSLGLQVPDWLAEIAARAKEAGASLEPPEGLPDILKDIRDIMWEIAKALGAAADNAGDWGDAMGDVDTPGGPGGGGDRDRYTAQGGLFKKLKRDSIILAHAGELAAIIPKHEAQGPVAFMTAQGGLSEGSYLGKNVEGDLSALWKEIQAKGHPLTSIGGGGPAPGPQTVQQAAAAAAAAAVAARPSVEVQSAPVVQVQMPEMTTARGAEVTREVIIPEFKRALANNEQDLADTIKEAVGLG
jgi:hypothetical protein